MLWLHRVPNKVALGQGGLVIEEFGHTGRCTILPGCLVTWIPAGS